METVLKEEKGKANEDFKKMLAQDLKSRKFLENEIVEGIVESVGRKYVFIDVGLKASGAIPVEEFRVNSEKIEPGAKVEVLLEKLEDRQGQIVLSFTKGKRLKSWKKLEESFLKKENVKGVLIGKIRGGFAISIYDCICFCPHSQLSSSPIKNINSIMKTELSWAILSLDKRRGNIVVSRRAVTDLIKQKDREQDMKGLKENQILKDCVCKSVVSYGAFFSYGNLDLMVHINEMSWSRVTTPSALVHVGQTCDILLYKIEGTRLSGSLKRLAPDPFIAAAEKYKPGDIVKDAIVHSIREFGAFVNIEPNLSGLVHTSHLDHLNPSIAPSKVVSVSQKIPVKILSIDPVERKLSLSLKECLPNPWEVFKEKYSAGKIVSCKVRQKNDYAIFLVIEDTPIVGMLHKSNISWDPKKGEDQLKKFHKNEILKAKIYEINDDKKHVQLSLRHMEIDPFESAFANKQVGDIITVTVDRADQKKGIWVTVGEKKFSVLIKKKELGMDESNQRISRFIKNSREDVLITELSKDQRKISLSISALEKKETEEKIKKYQHKDSGASLGDILRVALKSKSKKNDKKKKITV